MQNNWQVVVNTGVPGCTSSRRGNIVTLIKPDRTAFWKKMLLKEDLLQVQHGDDNEPEHASQDEGRSGKL